MEIIRNLFKSYADFKALNGKCQKNDITPKFINSMRIYLTENCNANCSYCFNKIIRGDGHMNTKKAGILFDYLAFNHVENLKIMGGEPTVHPDFVFLYNLSQSRFKSVSLFTNALNMEIMKIEPRPTDSIVYNFLFIDKKLNVDKFLPRSKFDFYRVFEIVIDSNSNIEELKGKIVWTQKQLIERKLKKYFFQLTLNCVEKIFENKTVLNLKFRDLLQFILSNCSEHISFDHTIPFCFWEETSIELMKKNSLNYYKNTCKGTDYGLIDSSFNLLHCNQFQENIHPLFMDDKILPFAMLNNLLKKTNLKKKVFNLEHRCLECEYFDSICTGGCVAHKL